MIQIGTRLLIKYENKLQEGIVEAIFPEELDIRLDIGILVRRKYWEVRIKSYDNEKETI